MRFMPSDFSEENYVRHSPGEEAGIKVPRNVEAEAMLLGALLIENRIGDDVRGKLRPEHFYEPMHARIFEKAMQLIDDGVTCTPVTMKPYFEDDPTMKELGGPSYLAKITGDGAGLVGARSFADQIYDLAMLRELALAASEMQKSASDTTESVSWEPVYEQFEDRIASLQGHSKKPMSQSFSDLMRENITELEEMSRTGDKPGITIDLYEDWNKVAGRGMGGDLIILAARPSMGKTAISTAIAAGAAKAGHPTKYKSIEMHGKKIALRACASILWEQDVTPTYTQLQEGNLLPHQWQELHKVEEEIDGWPLFIETCAEFYVEDLASDIRRTNRMLERKGQPPLKYCIIDYLGKIKTRQRFNNTNDRITYICHTLKEVAVKTETIMIVLAQLSRAIEQREDKRPLLSDLRDSGSIEQDADVVVFLYREEYYHVRTRPPENQPAKLETWKAKLFEIQHQLEIFSSKRREGALAKRLSYFNTEFQAIRDQDYFNWKSQQESTETMDRGWK